MNRREEILRQYLKSTPKGYRGGDPVLDHASEVVNEIQLLGSDEFSDEYKVWMQQIEKRIENMKAMQDPRQREAERIKIKNDLMENQKRTLDILNNPTGVMKRNPRMLASTKEPNIFQRNSELYKNFANRIPEEPTEEDRLKEYEMRMPSPSEVYQMDKENPLPPPDPEILRQQEDVFNRGPGSFQNIRKFFK